MDKVIWLIGFRDVRVSEVIRDIGCGYGDEYNHLSTRCCGGFIRQMQSKWELCILDYQNR